MTQTAHSLSFVLFSFSQLISLTLMVVLSLFLSFSLGGCFVDLVIAFNNADGQRVSGVCV
jgi:hypothetical protein